jgi:hypothetical protein
MGFWADRENGAIKQGLFRCMACSFEHKVGAALAERFGRAVDQAAFFWLDAQVEGLAFSNLTHILFCSSQDKLLFIILYKMDMRSECSCTGNNQIKLRDSDEGPVVRSSASQGEPRPRLIIEKAYPCVLEG